MPRSLPRESIDRVRSTGKILISSATLAELDDVLRRPRFDKYIQEEERLKFLAAFVRDAQLVQATANVTDCRDPRDNKFFELAVSGNADVIISGDKDLLVLHPFRGISVLTPQDFLTQPR